MNWVYLTKMYFLKTFRIQCISPREALHQLSENGLDKNNLIPGKQPGFYMMGFDKMQFQRNQFQVRYLYRFTYIFLNTFASLRTFSFQRPYKHLAMHMEGVEAQANMEHCLATILKHCCVKIPSWSEVCFGLPNILGINQFDQKDSYTKLLHRS